MATLGEQLRATRESLDIPLEEVANDLKISKKYLVALEDNNYSIFPAPVYLRGFLTNYAEYLGLDSKAALEQYSKLAVPDNDETENVPTKRSTRRVMRTRIIMLLAALLFCALSLLAIFWYNFYKGQ